LIFFIQETHLCNLEQVNKAKQIWQGNSFWSLGAHASCDVAILFKSRLEVEVLNVVDSAEGRYFIVECLIKWQNFNLVNVYCPNIDRDRADFLEKLDFEINNRSNLILAGDFNFVEDPILDKLGGDPNSGATSRSFFKKL
jgi:exonuclease III